jgi:hypothetical protein
MGSGVIGGTYNQVNGLVPFWYRCISDLLDYLSGEPMAHTLP